MTVLALYPKILNVDLLNVNKKKNCIFLKINFIEYL